MNVTRSLRQIWSRDIGISLAFGQEDSVPISSRVQTIVEYEKTISGLNANVKTAAAYPIDFVLRMHKGFSFHK
jgi:hypothetical protein